MAVLRPRPRPKRHRRMREDFNTVRPHSGSDAALIEGSAPPPVALPAPNGVTEMVAALIATSGFSQTLAHIACLEKPREFRVLQPCRVDRQ
jgi:hypothetical protein